jgi:hypothetical protein
MIIPVFQTYLRDASDLTFDQSFKVYRLYDNYAREEGVQLKSYCEELTHFLASSENPARTEQVNAILAEATQRYIQMNSVEVLAQTPVDDASASDGLVDISPVEEPDRSMIDEAKATLIKKFSK